MELKLDNEAMKALLSEAILNSLTSEQKQLMLQQALKHLVSPTPGYNGKKEPSPLETAFNHAVISVARELVNKSFEEDDTVATMIKELIAEATHKMFTVNRQSTVDKIAELLANGIVGKDRY